MTFDIAFDRVIGVEKGYVNNPRDPGGETNWGVSKREFPNVDIKNLTRDGAKKIYLEYFWSRIHADQLPGSVAFQTFDFAVNSGIETAVRYLQQAVGVADDGHWGPVTTAAAALTSETDMIMKLNALRLKFMVRCSNWSNASGGWANRIADNLLYGAQDT